MLVSEELKLARMDFASRANSALQSQLEYARHTFDNQQSTIRHLDSKAGVFITLLVFMATGTLAIARDACTRLHWTGKGSLPSWIYLVSSLLFVLGFLATGWSVQRVIRPRALPVQGSEKGFYLPVMFSVMIIRTTTIGR